jgi:Rieske Fe-S protein
MEPEDRRPPPVLSRRDFLAGSLAATAVVAGVGLTVAACGSGTPAPAPTPSRWVHVPVSGMTAGSAAWIVVRASGDGTAQAVAPSLPPTTESGFWLVAQANGKFLAFDPRCTHRRCLYDWDAASDRFACRCHGGYFGPDGGVLGGPPPFPLARYEVRQATAGSVDVGWWDPGSLEPEPS